MFVFRSHDMSEYLRDRLQSDLKEAMRNKDPLTRTLLRTLLSEVRNAEIAKRDSLDDDGIQRVLVKQAQQRRDSAEAYIGGERLDLADKENEELSIIMKYLPVQLTDTELAGIVDEVIKITGASGLSDMGKVMGELKKNYSDKNKAKYCHPLIQEMLTTMVIVFRKKN